MAPSLRRSRRSSPSTSVCTDYTLTPLDVSGDKPTSSRPEAPSRSNFQAGKPRKRFVGVRQRPSGRWVAEIKDTTQKIRLWLGTFDTAEEAAMAYDEAACLLRGKNTRTNFLPPTTSDHHSKVARLLLHRLRKDNHIIFNNNNNNNFNQSDMGDISPTLTHDMQSLFMLPHYTNFVSLGQESFNVQPKEEIVVEEDDRPQALNLMENVSHVLYPSPFQLATNLSIHSPHLELDLNEEKSAENIGEEKPQSLSLKETLKRMNYERAVSASLYAMNGVAECLMLNYTSGRSSFMASPSLSLPPSFHSTSQWKPCADDHS